MERHDIQNKVVDIVAEVLNIDKSSIKPESKFEDLGADSLDTLQIIVKLEEQFDIEIDDEKAAQITTIQQTVDNISKLLSK